MAMSTDEINAAKNESMDTAMSGIASAVYGRYVRQHIYSLGYHVKTDLTTAVAEATQSAKDSASAAAASAEAASGSASDAKTAKEYVEGKAAQIDTNTSEIGELKDTLFNFSYSMSDFTVGGYYDKSDSTVVFKTNGNCMYMDFLDISDYIGQTIVLGVNACSSTSGARFGLCDSSYGFNSSCGWKESEASWVLNEKTGLYEVSFSVPTGMKYLYVSLNKTGKTTISVYSSQLDSIKISTAASFSGVEEEIKANSDGIDALKDTLFNLNVSLDDFEAGKFYTQSGTSVALSTNTACIYTDFIDISDMAGQTVVFGVNAYGPNSTTRFGLCDANHTYNSGYSWQEKAAGWVQNEKTGLYEVSVVIPSGMKYLYASFLKSGKTTISISSAQIESLKNEIESVEEYTEAAIETFSAKLGNKLTRTVPVKKWKTFEYPSDFTGTFRPVNLYTDGILWKTDYDKENFKVSGSSSNTYYVSVTGKYANDGLTRSTATDLPGAYAKCSDGDTILILDGDYTRALANPDIPTISKSINIIGEGDVRLIVGNFMTPAASDVSGLYSVSLTNIARVFDDENEFEYTEVSSTTECAAQIHSVYIVNDTAYLNIGDDDVKPLLCLCSYAGMGFQAVSEDLNVYVENITIMGGQNCVSSTVPSGASTIYDSRLVFDGCRFTANAEKDNQNLCAIGIGHVIYYNCEASYSYSDGFSYVSANAITDESQKPQFMEINCRGFNNGYNLGDGRDNAYNGSTCHKGIHGIRVNGVYFNNVGGNVADVQAGTQTINCGCVAYDSCATSDTYKQGFSAQQAGAVMWLYNCEAFGNVYDFFTVQASGTTAASVLECEGCYHSTYNGTKWPAGTLVDDDPKTMEYLNTIKQLYIMQQLLN